MLKYSKVFQCGNWSVFKNDAAKLFKNTMLIFEEQKDIQA